MAKKSICREISIAKNDDMIGVFIKPCKKTKKKKEKRDEEAFDFLEDLWEED